MGIPMEMEDDEEELTYPDQENVHPGCPSPPIPTASAASPSPYDYDYSRGPISTAAVSLRQTHPNLPRAMAARPQSSPSSSDQADDIAFYPSHDPATDLPVPLGPHSNSSNSYNNNDSNNNNLHNYGGGSSSRNHVNVTPRGHEVVNNIHNNNTNSPLPRHNHSLSPRPETDDGLSPSSCSSSSCSSSSSSSSSPDQHLPYHAGMLVDVMDTVDKWCEAEILDVDPHRRTIYITYTFWSDQYNETLPFDSPRVAPAGSHTFNGDPETLKLRQRVEACDDYGKWREAEVIEVAEDRNSIKVHFRNWKSSFDTWIRRDSDRLRPYGRQKNNLHHRRRPPGLGAPPAPVIPPPHHHRHQASLNLKADHTRQITVLSDRHEHYRDALARQGLHIAPIEGDGNCLFRSVSYQIYGDDRHHHIVRERCMDYMELERHYFEPYVVGDMDDFMRYLAVKRRNAVWGDDPEVQALCELYDRPAEIWAYDAVQGAKKLRTFHEASGISSPDRPPMRLSYYGGGHYDSIYQADHMKHVVREPPGYLEDRAIEVARQRNALIAEGSRCVEEVKRRTDEEATEQAAVEAALKASRAEFDSFEDLDAALLLSSQAEIQAQILRTVAKQSEEEYMQKAVEESLRVASAEDDLLQEAIKQSLLQPDATTASAASAFGHGFEDEDPELSAALALSLEHPPGQHRVDVGEQVLEVQARTLERSRKKREEDDLMRAIAASLEDN